MVMLKAVHTGDYEKDRLVKSRIDLGIIVKIPVGSLETENILFFEKVAIHSFQNLSQPTRHKCYLSKRD